ncbi:MAG TPA: TraR/DksA C4-type zinc finger protein [Nevskiaceae bacterium]|nr:TraR/DksA C4-type zinc finger protein [Nevskiaceae bacterium]
MALMREEKAVIEEELRTRERELDPDDDELCAVGRAIEAIREGEYGHCTDCGADIPFERLRAQPTALRCARCEALFEKNFASQQRGPTL